MVSWVPRIAGNWNMGLSKKSSPHQGLLSPQPVAVSFLSWGMVALGHWILGSVPFDQTILPGCPLVRITLFRAGSHC